MAVVDSFGGTIAKFLANDGRPILLPSAELGGIRGRAVPMPTSEAFLQLLDTLLSSRHRFGLRVTIHTNGKDADNSDNVSTREWGGEIRLSSDLEVDIAMTFRGADTLRRLRFGHARMHMPIGAILVDSILQYQDVAGMPGHRAWFRIRLPKPVAYGAVVAGQLLALDSATGVIVQEKELFAQYDSLPPVVTSYRALLFSDGRIGIHVEAGDEDSGMSESSIETVYSTNGGRTWSRVVHDCIEDDFGHPAIFETVLGPFSRGTNVLVGIAAHDVVGNSSDSLPTDFSVLVAPDGAESALSLTDDALAYGNPIYKPNVIMRLRKMATDSESETISSAAGSQRVFLLRRRDELQSLPDSFVSWRVDPTKFLRVPSHLARTIGPGGAQWKVLALRVP